MGVAIVDILAGTHLAQGILAAIYQRMATNEGSLVQVSMLESILDFQFEVLTSFFNDGNEVPQRSKINNGHAYIAAPYGIYETEDGYLALSMGNIIALGKLLKCEPLMKYTEPADWFNDRDTIKGILATCLREQPTKYWTDILEAADIWCAKVLDYDMMIQEKGYQVMDMELNVKTSKGLSVKTTRCPIRIDGQLLVSETGAPTLGEHNQKIDEQFGIM
jgi:crotonobetainyl-CoA:carnitine CoA-transferase CaiB-like acyl-CoA transferase